MLGKRLCFQGVSFARRRRERAAGKFSAAGFPAHAFPTPEILRAGAQAVI
jgi:hypothetical protein